MLVLPLLGPGLEAVTTLMALGVRTLPSPACGAAVVALHTCRPIVIVFSFGAFCHVPGLQSVPRAELVALSVVAE